MDAAAKARAAVGAGGSGSPFERGLKIAVIVMGILIVLGVLTVIGRIIYLASRTPGQSASAQGLVAEPRLALPAGATVRAMSLSGDRLAVQFDAPSGAGIAVLDLASGKVLSRVELVPEPPKR